jgi:hypothetical protein
MEFAKSRNKFRFFVCVVVGSMPYFLSTALMESSVSTTRKTILSSVGIFPRRRAQPRLLGQRLGSWP